MNNALSSTTIVTVPKPGLVASALSTAAPRSRRAGGVLVSNTIKNQGGSRAGWSVAAFHLSTNQTYGDDLASIRIRTIVSLAIHATSTASTTIPEGE
jgi:hypothetical protein